MIGFEEATRLVRLQERLRAATYHEMKKPNTVHKSSEGNVSISFNLPPVVGDRDRPYWAVEVYSYLLCPGARTETFIGQTVGEAIGKAEDAVGSWCMMAEMEMFEVSYGIPPCGPDCPLANGEAPTEDEA